MKLLVSNPPHWHSGLSEKKIYRDFILGLIPALIHALYFFGMHAARVIALCVAIAVLSEIGVRKLFRKKVDPYNGSAVYTGILFAMLLPPTSPYWLVMIGVFITIFIGREIFGGVGSNPFSPVLVGMAVLELSWPTYLNVNLTSVNYNLGFDCHSPLTALKAAGADYTSKFSLIELSLGNQVGGIGSVAILFLLIGGIYLLIRKVIHWEIPLFFAFGVVCTAAIFRAINPNVFACPWFHLLTGNVVIGMFFLSTDYSSSPFSNPGKIIFGFGCGFLTVIFRALSVHEDGVIYAILIMNLFTPMLDKTGGKPRALSVVFPGRLKK
ncbi:MAG: RnfABCDGE type electron transport complex subunit D [Acidobacteriota bacterium]